MKKSLRDICKALSRSGIEVDAVTPTGSGHYRIHIRRGGKSARMIVSATPRRDNIKPAVAWAEANL